ncbi:MAG: hypothetical protein KJ718_04405 [Nanoarchaeota archaeon]|nr:hypothetical protein [Nanoarchaeota archaeon]MBU1051771.1 hypothetical protein [Nanoarchaeota archaeon]MBU1988348.1 hypothetical protein [Nanoarchaeota archaeon]
MATRRIGLGKVSLRCDYVSRRDGDYLVPQNRDGTPSSSQGLLIIKASTMSNPVWQVEVPDADEPEGAGPCII